MNLRVIKFGGSLLSAQHAASTFLDWRNRQTPATDILIAGGGPTVDCIRAWQTQHGLDDEGCHWLSIRAMSLTSELLHRLLPESVLTPDIESLRGPVDVIRIFDPLQWLATKNDLPTSWAVTSDSIAAMVARELAADELVLLKSRLPHLPARNLTELTVDGLTDQYFPVAAAGVPRVRLVNMRGKCEVIQLVNDRKPATL